MKLMTNQAIMFVAPSTIICIVLVTPTCLVFIYHVSIQVAVRKIGLQCTILLYSPYPVLGGWRKEYNEKLHNQYPLRVIKSRKMRWTRHVALWEDEKCAQNFNWKT